jgi:hypothetical protein
MRSFCGAADKQRFVRMQEARAFAQLGTSKQCKCTKPRQAAIKAALKWMQAEIRDILPEVDE